MNICRRLLGAVLSAWGRLFVTSLLNIEILDTPTERIMGGITRVCMWRPKGAGQTRLFGTQFAIALHLHASRFSRFLLRWTKKPILPAFLQTEGCNTDTDSVNQDWVCQAVSWHQSNHEACQAEEGKHALEYDRCYPLYMPFSEEMPGRTSSAFLALCIYITASGSPNSRVREDKNILCRCFILTRSI